MSKIIHSRRLYFEDRKREEDFLLCRAIFHIQRYSFSLATRGTNVLSKNVQKILVHSYWSYLKATFGPCVHSHVFKGLLRQAL